MLRLVLVIVALCVATTAAAVPPPPSFYEAVQRGDVNLEAFAASYIDAKIRGVDAPNPIYGPSNPPFGPDGAISNSHGHADDDMNVLILLVDFSDNVAQTPAVYFDSLGYAVGSFSLRNFYSEISYGQLDIVTVNYPSSTGWQRVDSTYAWYVNNNYGWGPYPRNTRRLCEDLCYIIDPIVDFSQYDNDNDGYVDGVNIVYAGTFDGTPSTIWPHAWVTYNPPYLDGVTVWSYSVQDEYENTPGDQSASTMCHEFGHVLGLPDLYDYGYDSYGVGKWCLMSFGVHNGGGWSPAHPCAWSRVAFGFAQMTNVTADDWYDLPAVEDTGVVYRLWTNGTASNEYFLVENRRPTGYDAALPAWGTLVWHIDDAVSGNNNQWYPGHTSSGHYQVALEQADGLWELEQYIDAGDGGDPYPGWTNNQFFNVSTTPDSKDYLFVDTQVAVDSIPASADTVQVYLKVGVVGVAEEPVALPTVISLSASPNPFNPSTTFSFDLPEAGRVILEVFDVLGRRVATLVDDKKVAGSYEVAWNADGLASGVYLARLNANGMILTARAVLLK
jgi:immune inhibitor A